VFYALVSALVTSICGAAAWVSACLFNHLCCALDAPELFCIACFALDAPVWVIHLSCAGAPEIYDPSSCFNAWLLNLLYCRLCFAALQRLFVVNRLIFKL
jgi:hypothetical protein